MFAVGPSVGNHSVRWPPGRARLLPLSGPLLMLRPSRWGTTNPTRKSQMSRKHALTAEEIALLREDIERALARLRKSMKTTRRAARPVELDQTSVGRLSRIDAIQNQSLTRGLEEREHAKLAQLTDALARLDEGSYGVCTGCGSPIAFERLSLFPETRTCSSCAS